MAAITTTSLTKQFDSLLAVDALDLAVEEGELYGFIGPNGAGKTTTINILTGQMNPTSGTASVLGVDPVLSPVEVRSNVGILPEREDPPSFMTPREYFEFVADIREIRNCEERVEEWASRLEFQGKLDSLNKNLSKGEKQKVMIAQAFLHRPDLVFIDEPLINLDPIMQKRVTDYIKRYNADGRTVFLSTHVLSLAEEICTRVGIIDRGQLVTEIGAEEFDTNDLTQMFLTEVEQFESTETDD